MKLANYGNCKAEYEVIARFAEKKEGVVFGTNFEGGCFAETLNSNNNHIYFECIRDYNCIHECKLWMPRG